MANTNSHTRRDVLKTLGFAALGGGLVSVLNGCQVNGGKSSEADFKSWKATVAYDGKGYVTGSHPELNKYEKLSVGDGSLVPNIDTVVDTLSQIDKDHQRLSKGENFERTFYRGKKAQQKEVTFTHLAATDKYLSEVLQEHYQHNQHNSPGREKIQQVQGTITLDRWLQEAPVKSSIQLGEYSVVVTGREGGQPIDEFTDSKFLVQVSLNVYHEGEKIKSYGRLTLKGDDYSLFGTDVNEHGKHTTALLPKKYHPKN